MMLKQNNVAYIDGANLHQGVKSLGWNLEKKKVLVVLSPSSKEKCSILLKRTGTRIAYLHDQHSHLESTQHEKAPDGDGTP